MKRSLAFVLLLGAILGLLGTQTAAAAAPLPTVALAAPPEASAMPADCMAMMGQHAPKPDKLPCTGVTLDCIAAMGCATPLANADTTLSGRALVAAPKLPLPAAPALHGNSLAPEPEPPSILV